VGGAVVEQVHSLCVDAFVPTHARRGVADGWGVL
jgi:hypothetical protein